MDQTTDQDTRCGVADDGVLHSLGLVDADVEKAFDNHTTLVSRVLNTPIALVSIVQPSQDRQYFKSHVGLPEALAQTRQTPLSHSFCQHVRAQNAPLVINDSRQHPILQHNGAVNDLNVIAYLGMPIHLPDGTPIGALCAIGSAPRNWTVADQQTLKQIAMCVDEQIALKAALKDAKAAEEKAQAAADAREKFLAHVSHEIRTPLNSIVGAVDLISAQMPRTGSDGDWPELLSTVEASAEGLMRLLNDTLDLSKIDAGKLELEVLPFSPVELAKEVLTLYRSAAAQNAVELRLTMVNDGAELLHLGDAFRLRQMLGNLVSNALKFTDSGFIEIAIRRADTDVVFTVTDTGVGMSSEQLETVFSAFAQAESSVARRKGGSGLGLAIVQRMAQAMGGDIRATSTTGHGSQFSLHLPLPQAPEQAKPRQATPITKADFRGKHVLVVDDSAANRLVVTKLLESLGANVTQSPDGANALDLMGAIDFDLVFLDIEMPGMSGVDVVQTYHATHCDHPTQPMAKLVAVTGNVMPKQMLGYLAAGFDMCLSKPLKRIDLVSLASELAA